MLLRKTILTSGYLSNRNLWDTATKVEKLMAMMPEALTDIRSDLNQELQMSAWGWKVNLRTMIWIEFQEIRFDT